MPGRERIIPKHFSTLEDTKHTHTTTADHRKKVMPISLLLLLLHAEFRHGNLPSHNTEYCTTTEKKLRAHPAQLHHLDRRDRVPKPAKLNGGSLSCRRNTPLQTPRCHEIPKEENKHGHVKLGADIAHFRTPSFRQAQTRTYPPSYGVLGR